MSESWTERICVGNSVYENATLTWRDGTVFIEFDANDDLALSSVVPASRLDQARDNERTLARYVHEAAGPESCLIPIASLVAISDEANRLREALREILADCPIGDSRHAKIARAALEVTPKENDAQDT